MDISKFSPDILARNPELARELGRGKPRVALVKPRAERLAETTAPNGRPFRSQLERRAWEEWVPTQRAARAWYEPLSLNLAGGRYTPDIVLQWQDGDLWLVEVKGSWKAFQSGRSSRRSLRQAAVEYASLGTFWVLMPAGRVRASAPVAWRLEQVR